IPALPSWQRLARGKARLRGDCQRRDAERNPARRGRFDEVTARDSHCAAPLLAQFILYSVRRDLLATASLTIFGRGSTGPAALPNFNAARVRFGSKPAVTSMLASGLLLFDDPTSIETARWSHQCQEET